MSQDLIFETKISGHTKRGVEIRGELVSDLVKQADFIDTLLLSLTGKHPSASEKKILNAILVASIDHGINPASGFVPRVVAASGNDVYTAMASALLALGPRHGGAITAAMQVMKEIDDQGPNMEAACQKLVNDYRQEKKRLPGFGHPVYRDEDPRTAELYSLAQSVGLDNKYINMSQMIALAIEQTLGKKLVINVDGAIAALLMTLHIDPLAGNALFGLARVGGSIAHIVEEMNTNNTVRRLTDEQIKYQP